ncbi:esterase S-like [Drosophila virilis]|uniref:Carboxylic ester hydrolase n=1 Tax=Drosophila virilis TaxID=7244 RepID=B4M5A2_DROVI|nr:esterase S-like [Drosophila virilis]EDW59813.1 uncharacterized protein Dvir_GJ10072 [Drosophila virilis]
MNYCCIIVAALLCVWPTTCLADPLLVRLPYGTLRGRDRGIYYTYESVPYAEPPVGPLRFEAPKPFAGKWKEIFDATRPSAECLQWSHFVTTPDQLTGSEDCLTVSIYKPKNSTRRTFPVVASIFGGAWSFGGTLEDGARGFMDSGNVIVVKINHRVGILGFANTGDADWSGNYALKDQRLAIKWIKKHIGYFGGDPNSILLFGFSSGAGSVHLQLMNEDMKGILKGVYSMSGNAVSPWSVQPSGVEQAYELGRVLGCGSPNNTAELKMCLQAVDANELARSFKHFLVYDYIPFAPFGPAVEPEDTVDPFITKLPIDIIKSGKFAQVPWLAGYTPEEGIYNAAIFLAKEPNGKERIYELNTRWYELAPYLFSYRNTMNRRERDSHSRKLRQHYMGNRRFSLENYWDFQRMFTNEIFKNSIELGVDLQRKYGKSPVYVYIYDNPSDHSFGQLLARRSDVFLGTAHGDDYFLMMNNPIREPLRPDEKVISWKLVKMVEGFLETGDFVYDNCTFPDNVGQKQFQLMVIQRTSCKVQKVDRLPDTVSSNLPPSPVVVY